MKLNLGCGANWKLYPEYMSLDIVDFGQEYVLDILEVLKDPDAADFQCEGYWDEVMANHFLEHFSQDELKIILSGINKMLKAGGTFKFVVPHKDAAKAWVLSHKTFWNEETVDFLAQPQNEIYGFGVWKIDECVVNDKKDMHVKLRKI